MAYNWLHLNSANTDLSCAREVQVQMSYSSNEGLGTVGSPICLKESKDIPGLLDPDWLLA